MNFYLVRGGQGGWEVGTGHLICTVMKIWQAIALMGYNYNYKQRRFLSTPPLYCNHKYILSALKKYGRILFIKII